MRAKEIKRMRTFVLRLDRGDEVISTLNRFCKENNIKGGIVYGIGAMSKAKFYAVTNSDEFEVNKNEINEPMEIVSAIGDISTNKDIKNIKLQTPIVHIHACVEVNGEREKAGHLLEGIIAYTGEFYILETNEIPKRKMGDLMLFDL